MKQRTVLADVRTPRVERAAAALGARILPLAGAAPPTPGPPRVTLAFAAPGEWQALIGRLRGPFGTPVVVVPLGTAVAPTDPHAAIARFVLSSQRSARSWGEWLPLGRLVVVEPGPMASAGGVYEAGEDDALDPEAIVAAARAGAAIVSAVAHEVLPPGAIVAAEGAAAAAVELRADARRARTLGAMARTWAERGRTLEDEATAWRAVAEEVESMARRGV